VVGGTTDSTGQSAEREIEAAGGKCMFVHCDVARLADLQDIVDRTVERYGRLDIYVANAGINDPDKTPYLEITPEQYDRIMAVNLRGCSSAGRKQPADGAAGQRRRDHQHVVRDGAPRAGRAGRLHDVQGGVQQLTRTQAIALAPYGIKVNAIAPARSRPT